MSIYDKVFKACSELGVGQKYSFLEYDQFVKKPNIIKQIVTNKDKINDLYLLLKNSKLPNIKRNPKGSIAKHNIHHAAGAWDVQEIYTAKNVFKGVIITVLIKGYTFVFKCGSFGTANSDLNGFKCFSKFKKTCEKHNIDLKKYESDKGIEIKQQIQSPYIKNFKQLKIINNVNHIDLNQAWPSEICKIYPEFKPVFADLRSENKLLADIALGFCQSEHCDYKYADLARIGINGCNNTIKNLVSKLIANMFEIIGINTDGIYYKDLTEANRLYHDEGEGSGLGQWKTDYIGYDFCAYSDGQYWLRKGAEFIVKARGTYAYELKKPRELWNAEDFDEAMKSLIMINWDKERGFVIYE